MKKFTKVLAIVLALVFVVCAFAACGGKGGNETEPETTPTAEGMKVGFIFLHDENSTYDNNFLVAAKAACDKLGV